MDAQKTVELYATLRSIKQRIHEAKLAIDIAERLINDVEKDLATQLQKYSDPDRK